MAFVLFIKSVANLLTNRAAVQWRLAWRCALPVTTWKEINHHVDLKADIWLRQRPAQIVSTVILAMSNRFNNISCVVSFDCNSTSFTRDACVNILQRIINPCWICSCSSHISFQFVAPSFYDFHGSTSTTWLYTDRYLCSMPAAWSELLLVQFTICDSAKCYCNAKKCRISSFNQVSSFWN